MQQDSDGPSNQGHGFVCSWWAHAAPWGLELALSCPSCRHQWQATFDIVSFFWSEINAWAHRSLQEVHTLALAYGWREADILAMSPWRRQFYLKMVSGWVTIWVVWWWGASTKQRCSSPGWRHSLSHLCKVNRFSGTNPDQSGWMYLLHLMIIVYNTCYYIDRRNASSIE